MFLCILSIILLLLILFFSVKHESYEPLNDKTVIMAWTHHCKNVRDGDWGLGDILKATYSLYEMSKRLKFKLIVDISQHNLSHFLVQQPHPYNNYVLENRNNIPYYNMEYDELEKQIYNDLKDKPITILFCSGFAQPFANSVNTESISIDAKQFLRKILTPKPNFRKLIQQKRYEIPFQTYSVLHYRLGDAYAFDCDDCKKGKDNGNPHIEELLNHIQTHKTGNDILLTDSSQFKQYAKPFIFVYDHPITHIRYSKNIDETKNTLIEFFILTQAKSIHSFTVYDWISGFVLSAHKIFDVPLTWEKD